ncbi:MAG TPA: DUF1559 domain-containing protein [Thermoguttaceae bacterium]|nr:DUF1559 domain-containing protein [Thermoguttaceae bacterium]
MVIPFTCPQCGTQTDVDERYAGQSGPCSKCGEIVTVPSLPTDAADTPRSGNNSTGMVLVIVGVLGAVALLVCGGMAAFWTITPTMVNRAPVQRSICQNNLKQIAMAMHMYHQEHGTFPPAYVADEDGTPMYSWRVLLLPYLEQNALYRQFDLTQPWDSPSNMMLTNTVLSIYNCPSSLQQNGLQTNYVMIVGSETLSEGTNTTDMARISDGSSRTIMIVEVAASGIHWAEPRDLTADEITFAINDGTSPGIGSNHQGGANVALCDGSVHFLSNGTSPSQVEAMSTIDGGEVVNLP